MGELLFTDNEDGDGDDKPPPPGAPPPDIHGPLPRPDGGAPLGADPLMVVSAPTAGLPPSSRSACSEVSWSGFLPAGADLKYDQPVFADFGISGLITRTTKLMPTSVKGTFNYMAPEAFEPPLGVEADVWSIGCVIVEMVTGQPPWALTRPRR